mgnify:CR=1 FL=1
MKFGQIRDFLNGQAFARVLVFPTLQQGPDFVRAFVNGDSRFTFTGTLDLRVQKGFRLGDRRVDVINYVKRKYGADNVAQIGTFGTLAARAAIAASSCWGGAISARDLRSASRTTAAVGTTSWRLGCPESVTVASMDGLYRRSGLGSSIRTRTVRVSGLTVAAT